MLPAGLLEVWHLESPTQPIPRIGICSFNHLHVVPHVCEALLCLTLFLGCSQMFHRLDGQIGLCAGQSIRNIRQL